jgi:hypothetical protein
MRSQVEATSGHWRQFNRCTEISAIKGILPRTNPALAELGGFCRAPDLSRHDGITTLAYQVAERFPHSSLLPSWPVVVRNSFVLGAACLAVIYILVRLRRA